MTVIKIIFMLILAVMERCHLVKREVIPIENTAPRSTPKPPNSFQGSWRMENLTATGSPENGQSGMEVGVVLSFFSDSTFTELAADGSYRAGKYQLQDSLLSFTLDKKTERNFLSFESGRHGRKMMVLRPANGRTRTFAEYAHALKNFKEDPFYFKNNTWRVKPARSQSDQELELKLANYILHNACLLRAAATRNQAVVSWEFSGGIIRIFNGGVGIVEKHGIPQTWKDAFFSDKEALRAVRLYEDCLLKYSADTDRTGNWVQDDANILMRIYGQLTTSA